MHDRKIRRRVTTIVLLSVLLIIAPGRIAAQETTPNAESQTAALEEALRLNEQVIKLYNENKYEDAIALAKRVLKTLETVLGPKHPAVATSLNTLARLHTAIGDYAGAEPLYQRALAINEKEFGPEHLNVAVTLDNLATLSFAQGNYGRADTFYQRVLAIYEKELGPEHPDVATLLNNLAEVNKEKGDYTRAETLYQRALTIYEKALGREHPHVATSLNNLAGMYMEKGDYARAEPLLQRALAIREKTLGLEHPDVTTTLNNLAALSDEKGDYRRGELLYKQALAISEKTFGPEHPGLATPLVNLAQHYNAQGDYTRAEPLLQRALAIREKSLGPEHPDVARSLTGLADLYRIKGDYARAEPLIRRALAIFERTLGSEHPAIASALNNLAMLHGEKEDYARAEQLFQRALLIREKTLGPEHPNTALLLNNLAVLYGAKGEIARALQVQTRANEIREHNFTLILATGSEQQKALYMAAFAGETDGTVSLHTRSATDDALAAQLALTTILRRKGRALDAMADQISSLRRRLNPADRALLDQLSLAQGQLSNLVLNGPRRFSPEEHGKAVSQLEAEVERLQAAISVRSAEFSAQSRPVTVEQVRQAIPAEAALVEFIYYEPYDFKTRRYAPAHYAVYVLRREGALLWANLGEASIIEKDVARLRTALADSESTNVRQMARAVDERVMRPIRRLLGPTRRIFLSPDGMLNLIPFAALVDERSRYLVEDYSLTYLTSGRDLLRLQARLTESGPVLATQPPIVIANPLFNNTQRAAHGQSSLAGSSNQESRRSIDFTKQRYEPLPGTAAEAGALRTLWPEAQVWTSAQATESRLKSVARPRLLHVATHGFFLADQPQIAADKRRPAQVGDAESLARSTPRSENPLLRSGLILAGVNQQQSGAGEDGVLTALEAAGLDLWGTKLVALSACETGIGDVKNGDGVYGLRRALFLAGAESQLMSLWQVSDDGTLELMFEYYKRLRAGEGRSEALRQVQLAMLKRPRRSHPFYWASFIQSGEWKNLDGKEAGAQMRAH